MSQDHHKSLGKITTARQNANESSSQTHSAADAREAVLALAKVLARQAAQEDDAAEAYHSSELEESDRAASSNSREVR